MKIYIATLLVFLLVIGCLIYFFLSMRNSVDSESSIPSAVTFDNVKKLLRRGEIQLAIGKYKNIELQDRHKYPLLLVTYPTAKTKYWDGTVRGVVFGKKEGWKVVVYIRTDIEYEQGIATIKADDSWVRHKTWPSPGLPNTIYAKLLDESGKRLLVSNDVRIVP